MDKVHGPGLVVTRGFTAIFSKFGLHATLGRFLPELKAQFVVNPVDSFRINDPAFTYEEHVYGLCPPGAPIHAARLV